MSDGGFCTDCGHRVASFEGLQSCPSCGSTGIPCADRNQVSVAVNWHELRVLVIWAENYGRSIDQQSTIYAIARRLEDQHPDRALEVPLSLAGELRQLKDAHPSMEVHGSQSDALNRDIGEFRRINDAPDEKRIEDV